jgi:hypothetical protein
MALVPPALPAPPALASPIIAQALTNQECLKRSTDLPLFYGQKEKDTFTAHHLVKRIDRAANIATWNQERTRTKF